MDYVKYLHVCRNRPLMLFYVHPRFLLIANVHRSENQLTENVTTGVELLSILAKFIGLSKKRPL